MHRKQKKLLVISLVFAFSVFLGLGLCNSTTLKVSTEVYAQRVSPCLDRVDIPDVEMHWIYVPESASALNTTEDYYYLAGQLISSGVVDASTCPSDGLTLNGYANACGMSVAKDTVVYVQNAMDGAILTAWKDVGVPPVLLKQMIRTESQFWPSMYQSTHFGYGHITNIGIRNALEWNSSLAYLVCPEGTISSCTTSTEIADRIISNLVTTCPTCEYGIDTTRAEKSVDILAEVVLGYCYQTARIINNATQWYSGDVVDYPTIWKLTLMNYNAGPDCVYNAVRAAFLRTNGPVNWDDIRAQVSGDQCVRGMTYANQITAKYYDFPP